MTMKMSVMALFF